MQLVGAQSGTGPNPVVFRGGPGHMASKAQDFCYAQCALGAMRFEVHVDVLYSGTSGALHEIDISLYDHNRATQIRRTRNTLPKTRTLYGAIECKFYDSDLGVALGRTFVGLISDCGTLRIKNFVTNGRSAGLAKYFSKNARPQPFFGVSPLARDSETRFVRVVEQELMKWAGIS